jgi:radical SAM protein with 4Fe4S-binding SPASM domain
MSVGQGEGRPDLAERLVQHALAAVQGFGTELPDPLGGMWAEVWSDWCRRIRPAEPETMFLIPNGTPAFQLLAWVAEAVLDHPDSPSARSAGEAMLAWYFALRIQDDIVDEGATGALSYLEQALTARALRCMAEAAGDADAMLGFHERLVRDFSSYALLDARQRADLDFAWSDEAVSLQGRKYLPMAGPLGALLIRAGRSGQLDALVALVVRLATGLQLSNDLFGADKDLANGERSPWLAALGLRPGLHGEADLSPAVLRAGRSGALDRYAQHIASAFDEAPGLLCLGSPRLSEHLECRRELLAEHVSSLRIRALTGARAFEAELEITRRCPLPCAHCYVRRREGRDARLPTELVLEIIEELSGHAARLHITGGEPLAHPGLEAIIERAVELGLDDIHINTAGPLLDAGRLDWLAASGATIELMLSLDGPPGVHDRVRGEGVTRAAIDAINGARARGMKAVPSSVLHRELLEFGLEAWHAWLTKELGSVEELVLWPLFLEPGREQLGVGASLDAEGLVRAARQVATLVGRGERITVADCPEMNVALARFGVPEGQLWQCGAGRSRLCVQADASVTPCHPMRFALERLQAGRVGGFVERAFAHPVQHRLAARGYEDCASCRERALCGSCQAAVLGSGLALGSITGACRGVLDALDVRGKSSGDRWKEPGGSR